MSTTEKNGQEKEIQLPEVKGNIALPIKKRETGSKKASPVNKSSNKSNKKTTQNNKSDKNKQIIPNSNFPRHSITKALRIPKAILDQNAGKGCSEMESASYLGVGYNGPFKVEVSSSIKYGLLERPSPGVVKPTELAKRIIRPQSSEDELSGIREAVLNAPVISDVYKHYRGENLPDTKFFENALTDTFKIPFEKLGEFTEIFRETLTTAKLIEKIGEKYRVLDISSQNDKSFVDTSSEIKKLIKGASINANDSCFVMMPFAAPLGNYYSQIYEPAIIKAGLNPVRADNDIFGTGKIIDQIWSGITAAKVLIAELTYRNPNVYYELGLAHALRKPVVLVSSNEEDVPFDLQHIRVIYYNVYDPFWGTKLIDKVAENILSAIKNPEEAILFKIST